MFVGAVAAIVVQVLGWLLLEGVAQVVVVWTPWPLFTVLMVLTVPVARPGLPTPTPSVAQSFAPGSPALTYFVPSLWIGARGDEFQVGWLLAGLGVLTVVGGVVLWRRVRHHRRASVPLVPLRRTDEAARNGCR